MSFYPKLIYLCPDTRLTLVILKDSGSANEHCDQLQAFAAQWWRPVDFMLCLVSGKVLGLEQDSGGKTSWRNKQLQWQGIGCGVAFSLRMVEVALVCWQN